VRTKDVQAKLGIWHQGQPDQEPGVRLSTGSGYIWLPLSNAPKIADWLIDIYERHEREQHADAPIPARKAAHMTRSSTE
jgi:hypothetical protein